MDWNSRGIIVVIVIIIVVVLLPLILLGVVVGITIPSSHSVDGTGNTLMGETHESGGKAFVGRYRRRNAVLDFGFFFLDKVIHYSSESGMIDQFRLV